MLLLLVSKLEPPYVAHAGLVWHTFLHHYNLSYDSSSGAHIAMELASESIMVITMIPDSISILDIEYSLNL